MVFFNVYLPTTVPDSKCGGIDFKRCIILIHYCFCFPKLLFEFSIPLVLAKRTRHRHHKRRSSLCLSLGACMEQMHLCEVAIARRQQHPVLKHPRHKDKYPSHQRSTWKQAHRMATGCKAARCGSGARTDGLQSISPRQVQLVTVRWGAYDARERRNNLRQPLLCASGI